MAPELPYLPLYKGGSQVSPFQYIFSQLKLISGGATRRFLILFFTAVLSTLVVSTFLFRVSIGNGCTLLAF